MGYLIKTLVTTYVCKKCIVIIKTEKGILAENLFLIAGEKYAESV